MTDCREIALEESLNGEWLKLPLPIMQECGQAVQTFGGLLEIATEETFVRQEEIARCSRVPLATCRKHLTTLTKRGWIVNKGRGRTPKGRPRRTVTFRITDKAKSQLVPYGILPWWACCGICNFGEFGEFCWCTRAVLSVWMAHLCKFRAACSRDPRDMDLEDFLEDHIGEDRWAMSLNRLSAQTGLSINSVIKAKQQLYAAGVIRLTGDGVNSDLFIPNWDFCVTVTPTSEGRVFIELNE